ncbi:hypothetical protein [Kordia sp. SMS9]|uniref:hypothetical protein n=1 Tax=Kordia sp. SMS9 TaxID=2282170 RepID=UPI0013B37F56|nr:hypothetical protein [Kordia sp. SMS9]
MRGFFWYSLGIIALKLADAVKPKIVTIDRKICVAILILGSVYIVAFLLMCFMFRDIVNLQFIFSDNPGKSQWYFWLSLFTYPVLLFIYTQVLKIDKLRNSMEFRGITAILFLLIR